MTLKWSAAVVAAVALTLGITANVAVALIPGSRLPVAVNIAAITTAGCAVVLVVVADLHARLDARLTILTEFVVARLDELESRSGDRDAGFVEGYLLGRQQDPTVIPITLRSGGRRPVVCRDD